jgi:hypothetical protein
MASIFPAAVTLAEDYMEVTGSIASVFVVSGRGGRISRICKC